MPLIVPPSAPLGAGTIRIEWVDPGGVTRNLSADGSPNLFVSGYPTGLGAPPVSLADEKLPWASGAVVRHLGIRPARMQLPLSIIADSSLALTQTLDEVQGWFSTGDEQRRTPGYLRVVREDGSVRQRLCYYVGGLEGDFRLGFDNWTTCVIELYAPDGYPTDGEDVFRTWTTADLPNVAVMNNGQLDAYPVWQITGPAQGIVVSNITSNKVWGWGGTVAAGQTLLVDTRPASQRFTYPVTTGAGVSQFLYMTTTSELWWFVPGANAINFNIVANATSETEIQLQYRQRYRGMLR
jgi:hypothetical protein